MSEFKKDLIYFCSNLDANGRYSVDVLDVYNWLTKQNKKIAERFWEKASEAWDKMEECRREMECKVGYTTWGRGDKE